MIDYEGIRLIEIGGDSCAGCIAVLPHCRDVAEKFGLGFIKLGVEDDPEESAKFEIERIPAIILADGGKPFARCYGYQPQEILEIWVEAKLSEHANTPKEKDR